VNHRSLLLYHVGKGNVTIYCNHVWDGKLRSHMWLLKRVGCIVCPIIICDGNNCSGVVVGVCN
jgi:hypothetical protein